MPNGSLECRELCEEKGMDGLLEGQGYMEKQRRKPVCFRLSAANTVHRRMSKILRPKVVDPLGCSQGRMLQDPPEVRSRKEKLKGLEVPSRKKKVEADLIVPSRKKVKGPEIATSANAAAFNIPLDVLVEILSWLPARSLVRFKSVCKLWLSLIEDPRFINRHLHNRSRMPNLNILILSWRGSFKPGEFSLHYFEEDCHKLDLTPFLARDHYRHEISNSCNGLICVFTITTTYVVNPSLREVLPLPNTHHTYAASVLQDKRATIEMTLKASQVGVALGYDISTGAYKIVRMFFQDYHSMGCMVLTFGSPSQSRHWRFIGNSPFPINPISPFVVNGFIVWTISSWHEGPEIAVSFDIKNETFDTIAHPEGSSRCGRFFVMELQGYLCFLNTPEPHFNWYKKELWILKDYNNRRWIKRSINLQRMEHPSCATVLSLSPLAIRGGRLLMYNHLGRFDIYDPDTGCFDKTVYLTCGYATPYSESLISPTRILHDNATNSRLPKGEGLVHDCKPWWQHRDHDQEGNLNGHAASVASGPGCCNCTRTDGSWWQWGSLSPYHFSAFRSKNSCEGCGACGGPQTDLRLWPKSTPKGLTVYS